MNKNIVTVVIASQNPVKIQATQEGFARLFPHCTVQYLGVSVDSEVPAQPFGTEETLRGAQNRIQNAKDIHPEADFWVGIEGGVEELYEDMWVFAWIVIQGRNKKGYAKTSSFVLPSHIVQYLNEGMELGVATDKVFGLQGSKQKGGVIGSLTKGHIDRKSYYVQPMLLALIPFLEY